PLHGATARDRQAAARLERRAARLGLRERVALSFGQRRAVRRIDVVPFGQRLQRSRRVPGERREGAWLPGREAAAMEAGRVAEDDRPLRRSEGHGPAVGAIGELVLGRVVLAEWAPRP